MRVPCPAARMTTASGFMAPSVAEDAIKAKGPPSARVKALIRFQRRLAISPCRRRRRHSSSRRRSACGSSRAGSRRCCGWRSNANGSRCRYGWRPRAWARWLRSWPRPRRLRPSCGCWSSRCCRAEAVRPVPVAFSLAADARWLALRLAVLAPLAPKCYGCRWTKQRRAASAKHLLRRVGDRFGDQRAELADAARHRAGRTGRAIGGVEPGVADLAADRRAGADRGRRSGEAGGEHFLAHRRLGELVERFVEVRRRHVRHYRRPCFFAPPAPPAVPPSLSSWLVKLLLPP